MRKAFYVLGIFLLMAGCKSDRSGDVQTTPSAEKENVSKYPIAFTSNDKSGKQAVFLISADGSESVDITKGWGSSVGLRGWLPGSNIVLLTSEHSGAWDAYQMDPSSRGTTALTKGGCWGCSPSSDGKSLFFVNQSNALLQQSIPPGEQVRSIDSGRCEHPLCSPNGKWVSYEKLGHTDRQSRDVWIYSRVEKKKFPLVTNPGYDHMVSWMPDNQLLVVSGGPDRHIICKVAVPSGEGGKVAEGYHPSVSPNGKYLAFLRSNPRRFLAEFAVINLENHQAIYTFEPSQHGWEPRSAPRSISWAPNSKELVFIATDLTEEDITSRREAEPSGMPRLDHNSSLIKVDVTTKKHTIIYEIVDQPIFDVEWRKNNK